MTVDYFTLTELPDKPMFRCERMAASLQVANCAERWKQANDRNAPERLDICRNCTIGAKHAGVDEVSLSPLCGLSICARCHQGTTRLIKAHLCVSCQNRQYEYLKGRNAKGSPPKLHPALHQVSVWFRAGHEIQTLTIQHATGMLEAVVAALRDTRKHVSFSFRGKAVGVMQGDLFA